MTLSRRLLLLSVTSCGFAFCIFPSIVDNAKNYLPDCSGKCEGNQAHWSTWTDWDECKGGECHAKLGRQSRQNICFMLVTPQSSNAEDGEERQRRKTDWLASCRQREQQTCVQELTCTGTWNSWGSWTMCATFRNATCIRYRERHCRNDLEETLVSSQCHGGFSGEREEQKCSNESCSAVKPRTPTVKVETPANPEESVNEGPKRKGLNHNMILIIAVAIGSLVFGAVFVLLLLNLVRRSPSRDDNSTSSRGDRWKRIGSTNTSSTGYSAGYVAASEVLSSRAEVFARSPSSATTGSGNSSSSNQIVCRNNACSPPTSKSASASGLITVCGAVTDNEANERGRRSRLFQENVYWEITDMHSLTFEDEAEESSQVGDIPGHARELVSNVLYGTSA